MSHDKIYCQLCGVTFNINRIRTRSEPRSSAWGNTFTSKHKSWDWVAVSAYDQGECPDGGCASVYRGRPVWERKLHPRLHRDDQADGTYTHESSEDEEPLEYDSNAEDDDDDDDDDDREMTGEGSPSQEPDARDEWVFDIHGLDLREYDDKFLPLDAAYGLLERARPYEDIENDPHILALPAGRKYEHIAGPGCRNLRGFHGDNITVEEMMDCQTVQGVYWKPANWTPLEDDLDFERESRYYRLTGLSDFMPPSGGGLRCAPVRGEVNECNASNTSELWNNNSGVRPHMLPFHPTCFEIFIRISKLRMGRVSLDSLVQLESNWSVDMFGRRHPDVEAAEGNGWGWHCIVGLEYLAANPVFIPGFRALCEAAISDVEGLDSSQSPFPERMEEGELSVVPDDPFLHLPAELKQAIVWHLGSKDIAALRLASRAFYHLPISLWHTLLVREMPWIYEAWCDDPTPYPWAMADASQLKQIRDQEEQYSLERAHKAEVLRIHEPDLYPIWERNEPKSPPWFETPEFQARLQQGLDVKRALMPIRLPRDRTNWYQLYTAIKANAWSLKGLRNRKRIWANVEAIVAKIKAKWEQELREREEDVDMAFDDM